MKCRVVTPNTDACSQPATHILEFGDGDKANACLRCALYMQQIAESHGTKIKMEKLDP